jgi:hypothetical protein
MAKNFIFILVLFVCQQLVGAQEQSLEKILRNYYKAAGHKKMQAVKTITLTGIDTKNDVMPLKITKQRPDKYRMDHQVADIEGIQAFDGQTGWYIAPWTGNSKPVKMNEDATGGIRLRADFEGLLYKWKEKGHFVELVGSEKIESKNFYKIKLTRKDGGVEHFFINSVDYSLERHETKRTVRGKETLVTTIFSGFRTVEGIPFPFVVETLYNGQGFSIIEYEKIELNLIIDDSYFKMPGQ